MKKNHYLSSALVLCVLIYSVAGFGQQLNPFMVKQKTSTQSTQKAIQPLPPNLAGNFSAARTNNLPVSLSYSPMAFIQPGAINTDLFTSLRHDENGLLIFAESKAGKETYFNSKSEKGRVEACYNYLGELKKAMRISDPANEFTELAVWSDDLDMVHYKMQQYYEGIKVYGGQVILHGTEGMINKINGTYFPTPDLTDLIPTIDKKQAIETAVENLSQATSYKELNEKNKTLLEYQGPEAELIIYHNLRDLTSEQLAYRITIRPNVIEHWAVYVDAKSGSVINKYNMTCTEGPATAQAQDLNGVTQTIHTYQTNGQYYMIDASRPMYNGGQSQLPDNPVGAIWTIDAQNSNMQDLQVSHITSNNNSWNYPTAVSAHNNAGITYEYFKNTHSRNSIDGQGGTIISIINVTDDNGGGLDNAFWNGKAMFYGNGNQLFLPLAGALDVGGHEISHGVTQHTANLEYQGQSGAINESMSDIVGCMVDRDDWLLGEDIIPSNSTNYPSGALRDMQIHTTAAAVWEMVDGSQSTPMKCITVIRIMVGCTLTAEL
jgi:Zn-dependent metalloprotease